MDLDKLVIDKLVSRGFTKKQLLNNRGIIGATIDEVKELLSKNITYEPLLGVVFTPKKMAEWFHDNYEDVARVEGWQTQDKCKVEFDKLPEKNKITMIKVCERWLNNS